LATIQKPIERERAMPFKNRILTTLVVAALAAALGLIDNASAAAKKLTYEQAYAKCKSIMDKEGTPGTSTQSNVRHTRGAACMKKYGHRL
jgi:hypothetical protein